VEIPPEVPAEVPVIIVPQEKKVWGPGMTLAFGLAIFVVYFVSQTIVASVFTFYEIAKDPYFVSSELMDNVGGLMLAVATIFSAIAGCGFIALFIKFRKGLSIKEYLRLQWINKKTLLILVAVMLGLILVLTIVGQFTDNSQENQQFSVDSYKSSIWPPLYWIAVVIFAPVFEEAFFRGFLFIGLKNSRLGAIGTIILTSLAWALLHIQYNIWGVVTILILGIVLGTVRLKTNSLWSTILLHSAWNTIAMISTVLYINNIGV
jgi:uncharacterized protein